MKFLLGACLLLSLFADAANAGYGAVYIEAYLVSYNEKIIRFKTDTNQMVTVPRSSHSDLDQYVIGKAKLKVKLTDEVLSQLKIKTRSIKWKNYWFCC